MLCLLRILICQFMVVKRYQLVSKNCSIKLSIEKVCNIVVLLYLDFYNDNGYDNYNDYDDDNVYDDDNN